MFCDLHMHSTASDGTDPPESLPTLAKDAGLAAIALTDHDTAAGLPACADAASRVGIAFVPGIELSADPRVAASLSETDAPGIPATGTLHILGYFIRHDDPQLAKLEGWLREARAQRNPQIVSRLNQLGVKIDYDDVIELAGGRVVGRPHIAQVLVRKGYVKSIHEAFVRYLGEGAAAHVRKDRLAADRAIDAIHHAGGLAMLAHPVQLRLPRPAALEHLVARLKDLGLDGIETRHCDHSARDTAHFEDLANRFDLLTTGGSDYHGSRKTCRLNDSRVPYSAYEALLGAHTARAAG